jgi:hypothetical protein
MSPLEPLAPDQRAVVALVLQQGRSYEDIATLLGIPVEAVRARAHAGLAALAPGNGLPGEITAPLADYLLGQQDARDADATRGLLAESAPARDWAANVADRLEGVAPHGLPEVPGARPAAAAAAPPDGAGAAPPAEAVPRGTEEAGPPAGDATGADAPAGAAPPEGTEAADPSASAATGPPPGAAAAPASAAGEPPAGPEARAAGAPPPASKLGGALLIGAAVVAVGVVMFLVLRGGNDEEPASTGAAAPTATATPTPTATATAQVTDQIPLRGAGGAKAKGTMTVYLQRGQLGFALQATGVPRSGNGDAYAVWFTGPGSKAVRLGFTSPVGADGKLGIQGPSAAGAKAFPRQYATYRDVVVSRETNQAATQPAAVIMRGSLPRGG